MKRLTFVIFVFLSSCGYEPKCKNPSPGELSFPLELHIEGNKLFVLNSDAGTSFCSGFISLYTLSPGNPPSWEMDIFPYPASGEAPHMLGGFDVAENLIAVSDRFNGQVIITDFNSYSKAHCMPPDKVEGCASEVIDKFREPLQVAFAKGDEWLFVSSTPLGEIRGYRKAEDGYHLSITYAFIAPLTSAVTSFISKVSEEVIITYREWSSIYVIKITDSVEVSASSALSYGTVAVGGIRDVKKFSSGFLLLSRNPDAVILADSDFNPLKTSYAGIRPAELAYSGNILAVTLQGEGKIAFFTLPGLIPAGHVEVCENPVEIVSVPDAQHEFVVSCFYQGKILGVSFEEGVIWEIP